MLATVLTLSSFRKLQLELKFLGFQEIFFFRKFTDYYKTCKVEKCDCEQSLCLIYFNIYIVYIFPTKSIYTFYANDVLWEWRIVSLTITILDSIHRPVCYLKQDDSETEASLRNVVL
jgi:hypothetical protein